MSPALLTILTFGAVATALLGIYSIASDVFLRDRARVDLRVSGEFRLQNRERARKSLLFKDLGQIAAEAAAGSGPAPGFRQRWASTLEQSGLDLSTRKLVALTVGSGLALGAVGGLLKQSLPAAVVGGLAGASIPPLYVQFRRKSRVEKLLAQLPDSFELMARVIRAGQTISQALQSVADEFPEPIAGEFGYCYEQQNLGLPPEASFRDLARRTGLVEIQIFIMGLLVQQQTGGNLAELLDRLSNIIRARYRMRRQIKTLTAEGRMQAMILLGLPPALFVAMLATNYSYAITLFDHPRLITGTLVCEGIGALWIRKIVNFEF